MNPEHKPLYAEGNIEHELIAKELVDKALETLPAEEQQILRLRYQGMTYKEIAEVMMYPNMKKARDAGLMGLQRLYRNKDVERPVFEYFDDILSRKFQHEENEQEE